MLPSDRRGFALLATLWVLAVLAAVAVTVMAAARSERQAAINAATEARSRWATAAGLAILLEQLQDGTAEHSLKVLTRPADSTVPPVRFRMNGLDTRVDIVDARSRLNLNVADSLQLRRLLEVMGVAGPKAAALTSAILDWRDPDSARRPDGAEEPDYADLRPPAAPRNGPFDTEADIRKVLGVGDALAARLESFVGTAGDGRVNVNTAPPAVLATLPGLSLEGARRLATRRTEVVFENVFDLVHTLPPEDANQIQRNFRQFQDRIAFAPRDLELTVTAATGGGVVSRLRAVVRMGGGTSMEILRVHHLGHP
jgi:general secretion pathway protein K